ncbi:transcriptional regulator with XRE-family HTH domain [Nocardia transvalensis]|uniref:Transcriptional regulator with XRE-family HTH domain n=1 Tax=Nocardia transvalensis TaxID=37333 RepID=A0A7W9PLI6_9NOCA|nr:helix-turn-helix domain-containing protein [Nocardia transvalensis]MBB5918380.1 transcriptional regulator with XRE-family HTH domain [Nocardia transvalensis]
MVEVEWTAHEIRALRATSKMSRPEFARLIGVTRRTLSLWESGRTGQPRAASRRLLDHVLASTDADTIARFDQRTRSTALVPEREVEDEMQRRQFLSAVAAAIAGGPDALEHWLPRLPAAVAALPTRVGAADVAQLRSITDDLRRMANHHGGCAAVDAACGALSWSSQLLPRASTPSVRDDLCLALAHLANIAGWACHDAGNQEQARRLLAQALTYSRSVDSAEADSLTATGMYGLGRISLHQRKPKETLWFAQLGQVAAQGGRDLSGSARLHATAAWAYALMGQHRQVEDSLDRAHHEMCRVDTATLEPWHRLFFTHGDFTGHRALVSQVLATSDSVNARTYAERAAELATTSLAESGPDRAPRSLLFDRIVLATSQLLAHDVDAGTATAFHALSDAGAIRSVRAVERFAEVGTAAQPFVSRHSGADQIVSEIKALMPSDHD